MRFAVEAWLVLLALLPLLGLLLRWTDGRAARDLNRLFGPRVETQVERRNVRVRQWQRFLVFSGLFWLVIALARPQWGASEVTITQKGTDIVIALDVSNSMLAEDVAPNRLERAKAEIGRFLTKQDRSRVGLILFAGAAFVQCPLTTDYGTANLFLRMAEPDMISQQGTAIASALAVSRETLMSAGGRGDAFQAILLVTDGEDLEGDWESEAQACRDNDIVVIPVGIGDESGGLIPVYDAQGRSDGFMKDAEGTLVMTRLDLASLERLAGIGGGSSFRVGVDGLAGDRLRAVLDRLGERELEERRITAFQERFAWPLAAALFCLGLRAVVGPRRRRDAVATVPRISALALVALAGGILTATVTRADPLRPEGARDADRGREHYLAGDYESALQEFESARALAPDDPRLSLAVGATLHQLEQYQNALTEFQRALMQTDDTSLRAESLYNAGTSMLALGDPQQAAQLLRGSLELEPNRDDALFNLEVALRRLEEQQQSQQDDQQQGQDDQQDEQEQQDQQEQQENQDQQDQQDRQDSQQDQQQSQDEQSEENSDQQSPPEQESQPESQSGESPEEQQEDQEQADPQQTEEPSTEDLTREQALQLLRALDRDEEELKRSVQNRLQGKGNQTGKRW